MHCTSQALYSLSTYVFWNTFFLFFFLLLFFLFFYLLMFAGMAGREVEERVLVADVDEVVSALLE